MNKTCEKKPQIISFRDWMYERYLPCYDPENPKHADYEGGEEYVTLAHDMDRVHCPVDSDCLMDYVNHMGHSVGRVDPLIYGVLVSAFMQYQADMEFRKQREDDMCVLGCMLTSKLGADLARLWAGDWAFKYDSHSEADLALCINLAYWTKGDVYQMDRLFRQSGLMRAKWDVQRGGTTYGRKTIRDAISSLEDGNAV